VKDYISHTPTSVTTIHRDNHVKDKYTFKTVENDERILARNKRIRLEGLMKPGVIAPVINDAIELAFSIPPMAFSRMKKDAPDIHALLRSRDPEDQKRGGRKLAILHPEWVVTEAHR